MKAKVALKTRILMAVGLAGLLPALLGFAAYYGSALHFTSESLHAFMEVSGGCVAVAVAVLLVDRIEREEAPWLVWTLGALTGMGLLDIAHGAWPYGNAWSWLRGLGTALGGAIFSLVWLPARLSPQPRRFIVQMFLAALAITAAIALTRQHLPLMAFSGGEYTLWTKGLSTFGGLGFLAASFFFFCRFARTQITENLVFAALTLVFAVAGLLIWFSRNWYLEWWLWHALRLGAYLVVVFAAHDVVQRRQQQLALRKTQLEGEVQIGAQALRAYQRQLAELFDSTPDGVQLLDSGLRLQEMNPAAKAMLAARGVDVDAIIGKSIWEAFPDLRKDAAGEQLRRVMAERAATHFEHFYLPFQRWYDVRIFPLSSGGLAIFFQDITERKIAEQALRRSEAWQRLLLTHVQDFAILSTDAAGRITEWNPGAQSMFGYTRQEILGRSGSILFTPEDRSAGIPEKELVAAETEDSAPDERWHIRKNGERFFASGVMRPLRDSKGKTIGFIKVARDITDHKLREQHLAELARLLNLSNDAIIVCDFDDRIRYWSHGAETLYGWSAQEAVGRIKHQLLQTLYLQPRAEVLAILERDNRWNGELIQTTRTGARVVVNTRWALDRDPEGRPASILKTDNDITARKDAEAALRESEERFRAMAENIPQLAWMADGQGQAFWFNRRWTEYTGLTLAQLQEERWQKAHDPAHLQRVLQSWNAAVASGQPWQDVYPLRHHSGRYGWFLSRAFPIRDDSGKITRWFGTTTDITELRETQDALHQAQEQLQQHAARLEKTVDERTAKLRETVEDLEAFSYSIAHDMRAPLRAMQGFSNMLQDEFGEQASSDAKEYLRRITTSASRLDRLIQDVLNYSKVVRGELSLESVETEKFLHEIVESYPNLQSLQAEISIRGPMPPILANRAALTQVVSNLLGNAVKFVQPGLKPNVRIWAETRSNQQNGQPPETWVRVWFADNGIGIPANAQQRIFMMFQRLNPSTEYEGTGIGLSIVRKAIERMGGKVGVTSEPGKGSQFWIQLKQANPES